MKRFNKTNRVLAASAASVIALTSFGGVSVFADEATTVNIAIQPSSAFTPLYVVREEGWLEEALADKGVEVVWQDFESGPPMNESLAAGYSDFGVIGDVPTVSAIAAGQKNYIVATACDAPNSYAMLVSADSEIEKVEDLKGAKIGTTIGSTGHNLTDKLLKTVDLDINSDVEVINITTGDAAAVLSNHEVDAVSIWEPNITRLVDDGTAKILATGEDGGLLGVNTIVARQEFADENPEIVQIVIEQYARAVSELESIDDDTWARVAEDLSLDGDQLKSILGKYDYKVTIDDNDIENLNDTIRFLVTIGNLDEEYDIAPYANKSFVEAADIDQYLSQE